MSLRKTFVGALLGAIFVTPCLGVCAGWSVSADDRMVCCADKSQNEADTCCASGEGRQNADVFAGLVLAALSVPSADASQIESILTTPQIFTPQWDSHDRIPSDSHRHVLLSVFLI